MIKRRVSLRSKLHYYPEGALWNGWRHTLVEEPLGQVTALPRDENGSLRHPNHTTGCSSRHSNLENSVKKTKPGIPAPAWWCVMSVEFSIYVGCLMATPPRQTPPSSDAWCHGSFLPYITSGSPLLTLWSQWSSFSLFTNKGVAPPTQVGCFSCPLAYLSNTNEVNKVQ